MKERLQAKADSVSEKVKTKFPKQHEKGAHYLNVVKDVWVETFPNSEKKA